MMTSSKFTLPPLSKWHKKIYLGYVIQILESQKLMTKNSGENILHYTLQENAQFEHMSHYPRGDRIDHKTGAQYFYHCHREHYERSEHGHFHCFLRYKYIPKSIKPEPLSDWDRYLDNPMTHLVAISMNQLGQPIRLFTVNRWVTSEIWYAAEYVGRFIKRYKLTLIDDLYWQALDKWVEGIIHLFTPQIIWLHQERDKKIVYHQNSSIENPYMNNTLEELSEISIDLKQQIEWILE